MKKIILVLCIIWAGFIAYNTSEVGEVSNNKSTLMVEAILGKTESVINNYLENDKQAININSNSTFIKKMNVLFRKFAHAFEFLIFAILLYWFLNSFKLKDREVIIYTLFIILLYAVMDEFRQLYIPQRGSSVRDVVIDFVGGILGVIISCLIITFKRKFLRSLNR